MYLWDEGGGFEYGEKMRDLQKREFSLNQKNNVTRLFRIWWNLLYLLEGAWRVLMKQKQGCNRKKKFYNEKWGNIVWGGLVKVLQDSACITILWKLSLPKGGSLLRDEEMRLAGIRLHTDCKGISGYCYHCWVLGAIFMGFVDVCLEKKGRFWGDAGAEYLPSWSSRGEVWRQ